MIQVVFGCKISCKYNFWLPSFESFLVDQRSCRISMKSLYFPFWSTHIWNQCLDLSLKQSMDTGVYEFMIEQYLFQYIGYSQTYIHIDYKMYSFSIIFGESIGNHGGTFFWKLELFVQEPSCWYKSHGCLLHQAGKPGLFGWLSR